MGGDNEARGGLIRFACVSPSSSRLPGESIVGALGRLGELLILGVGHLVLEADQDGLDAALGGPVLERRELVDVDLEDCKKEGIG